MGRLRHELAAQEKTWLEEAVGRTIWLEPRQTLVERGERIERSYYIIEGTVLRHRDDRKGERQLVGLNIPGDFVDLHGFPMKRLDHNTTALGGKLIKRLVICGAA
ncbi:cyclic nucleotide-binding domain-containing protein [Croceicoccus hydrothermalis]|uniref:cyclic nucleotide-binding domain-containing protein n=1 Tax=Croceicoccus hydrothermalis TaxID=2867964 RepID=UPI001EFAB0B4|nr:cyclic nucleotide-binding domain-containing protein [Croceicoccus hydrothermalis]